MTTVTLKKQAQMKRTGLYMPADLHREFEQWAEDNGVSFNQAAIYFMRLGMESTEVKK